MLLLASLSLPAAGVPAVAAPAEMPPPAHSPEVSDPPGPTELRRQLGRLLQTEATTRGSDAHTRAVVELADFHAALRCDPRIHESAMIAGQAASARRRLLSVAGRLEQQLRRDGIARPADLDQRIEAALDERALEEVAREAGALEAGTTEDAVEEATVEPGSRGAEPWPAPRTPGEGPQGGGAVPDEGWRLVELIQRSIHPDFWDPRGGPGVIRYFALHRVLVVRATSHVHDDLRQTLKNLRRR